MAIIKTPAAADSPYPVTADATPAVLRASASGATVLANVAAAVTAAATVNATATTAAAAANVSYYATGIEGVQGLANYGRVFAGANVYVTLEQPQYVTYNQNFTGNGTVGGTNGQIQFNNNGAFGGSTNLTFDGANLAVGGTINGSQVSTTGSVTGGNLLTGGRISAAGNVNANYFVGNGSQLTGINAGSSSKIFNGNSYANIAAAGGDLVVGINGGNTWTFNSASTLTAPGGSRWQNAANSDAYFTSSLDGYVHLQSFYADANIASEIFLEHGLVTITAHSLGANADVVWTFGSNGSTIFPTLITQRGDNPSGTISGQTLLFGNALQEAIISTPDGTTGNEYSQRLVINPGAGNNFGEGGDIYLWAGRGGDGSGTGGDIKIRGGQGGANTQGGVGGDGGYIRMEAGDAASTGGAPGYIQITGGYSNTAGGYVDVTGGYGATVGGDVKLYGGYGQATGGNVNIWGGASGNGQSNEGHVNIETGGNTWTFAADGKITLPNGASLKDTSGDSVAFGQAAGANSQAQHAVAIGLNAGREFQGEDSVAIGLDAGYYNQGRGVAIGYRAGQGTSQSTPVSATYGGSGPAHTYVSGDGNPSLVLDSVTNVITYNQYVTGNNIPANTYVTNIYPGEDRIEISQAPTAALSPGDIVTFIGSNIGVASTSSLVAGARVLGTSIPEGTYINSILGPNNIDISQRPSAALVDAAYLEFYIGQGEYATAVGYDAGTQYQDVNAVAVGRSAGTNHQGANTVAVGYVAGAYSQGANAVAVGTFAGTTTQGINAVAVGYRTGGNTQGAHAVAIGEDAGNDNQHAGAVAIGAEAGRTQQGNAAVAMGWKAGNYLQGLNAIAIGEDAGRDNQGAYSIAIGYYAGFNSQANNTVVLNATGSYLTAQTANTFVVAPVRASTLNDYSLDTGNVLYYNTSTHEITTAPVNNITGDPYAAFASDTSNVTVWTASSDQVVGAKLTVQVVYFDGSWQNTELLDITAVKNYPAGTPAFTVSNRVKTNPAYQNVSIDVTLTGGNIMQVISSTPDGIGNSVYWTCSATSFNQTFD